jgi:hypothetical protein
VAASAKEDAWEAERLEEVRVSGVLRSRVLGGGDGGEISWATLFLNELILFTNFARMRRGSHASFSARID